LKKKFRFARLNESGLSLIEVIVSIVLLSIILISILALLTQGAKTTKSSETIIDATYIAQSEMEKAFLASKSTPFIAPNCKNAIQEIDNDTVTETNFKYIAKADTNNNDCSMTFEKYDQETNAFITLKLEPKTSYPNISTIIIQVYEQKNDARPKAQMQSTLEWMVDTNEN